jgi:hypothetical protein
MKMSNYNNHCHDRDGDELEVDGHTDDDDRSCADDSDYDNYQYYDLDGSDDYRTTIV